MTQLSGTCSCGDIKVSIPAGRPVGTCHCSDCRKATGGTHGISFEVPKSQLEISGTPKMYSVNGVSGNAVRRFFCGTCGSPLYVQCDMDKAENEEDSRVFVKLGLFPPKSSSKPTMNLFVRDMEDWETPTPGAKALDTQ